MKFVKKITTQTIEIKQSKFIAYLLPYSKYPATLEELKSTNPKARHFVVAYRYLNQFHQIIEHSSDDGEPKGTSGKPSLMVLQGADVINSAVIIVRYFGGTKLGTGGLVRAYSDAVNVVLESAQLLDYKHKITKEIFIEYTNLRLVEYECIASEIEILEKSFDTKIKYKLQGSETSMELFLEKLNRLVEVI